jgi:hypothetical protein
MHEGFGNNTSHPLNIQSLTLTEVLDSGYRLCRTGKIHTTPGHHAFLFEDRSLTGRAVTADRFVKVISAGTLGAFFFHHRHDRRDDLPGFFDDDGISDPYIFTLNFILIM